MSAGDIYKEKDVILYTAYILFASTDIIRPMGRYQSFTIEYRSIEIYTEIDHTDRPPYTGHTHTSYTSYTCEYWGYGCCLGTNSAAVTENVVCKSN